MNATEFVSYKIAPVNIRETLWNDEAELLTTCTQANVDLKIVPEESRSQGSRNGIRAWRQDEGKCNRASREPERVLGELEWPLSACSGMLTLGSGTGSQNGFHIMVRRLTQGVLRLWSGSGQACSGSALAYSPSAQVYSPSAQVKAPVAHVCRLKWN